MSSSDANVPAGPDVQAGRRSDQTRRILAAWVGEQAERLDDAERRALNADLPTWRADAAQLIAEGLLAYVALEMVVPDLAIAQAEGRSAHTDDADLSARLVAHLQDFLDYRAELQQRGGLHADASTGHQH